MQLYQKQKNIYIITYDKVFVLKKGFRNGDVSNIYWRP